EKPATSDDLIQYAKALEILCDVGKEIDEDLTELRDMSWEVVSIYRHLRHLPALGQAVLAFSNTCRILKDERTASTMAKHAYHILNERCPSSAPGVARSLHQSIVWQVRRAGADSDRHKMKLKCDRLVQLSNEVGTVNIRLETVRELAGYWDKVGKSDAAQQ